MTPRRAVHVFAIANIAFLGIDIAIAHMENAFAQRVEWAPVYFSAIATALLMPGMLGVGAHRAATIDRIVAVFAIAVGITGMLLHLSSAFFAAQTLHNLVYAAPFIAPLSYVGVGCLLLLVRSDDEHFDAWVLALALGGCIGNFALALLDHAQNGFFHWTEWIPVAAAALAIGYLVVELARPRAQSRLYAIAVLAGQAGVGLLGFVLHLRVDLLAHGARPTDGFVFGAPVFAPLLFADLAVLAGLGLWARHVSGR